MKFLTVILLLFCSHSLVAQIENVDASITEYNAKIDRAIQEDMEAIVPHISSTCPLMLPAIGPVDHTVTIFFDLIQKDSDEGVIANAATIRKASFAIQTGSYQTYNVYHFDNSGNLIFHSTKMEDGDYGSTQSSYYFEEGKCIQLTTEQLAKEDTEIPVNNQPVIRTDLTTEDLIVVEAVIQNALKYKDLLALYSSIMID